MLLAGVGLASVQAASPAAPDPVRALYSRPGPADLPGGTATAAQVELGRRLFFDPALSASGQTSCATCHDPARGFTDGRPRARGVDGQPLRRRTPTLWNLAWAPFLFWDGRAPGLEAQARAPIEAHDEMGQPLAALADRLAADPAYGPAFDTAFPDAASPRTTGDNLVRAIAAWERTLVSPPTRFDAWVAGDSGALTAPEQRGFGLFNGKAGCATCHSGWAFTDHAFYDIGLPADADLGRGPVLGIDRANHAFKTPTLRELLRGGEGPFMHDGSLPTLASVLDHYERRVAPRPTLAPELPRRLALSPRDRSDLLAFLATLTSAPGTPLPPFVEPPVAVPAAAPDPHPVQLARVSQRGRRFAPGRIAVQRGGTVEITNNDTTAHNIRIDAPGMTRNSGIQDPGQVVAWRMDMPGRFTAFCGIHPAMRLEIEVPGMDPQQAALPPEARSP